MPRGTPGWHVSGLPRTEWIGVLPDDVSEDPARRGCCARNIAPEGRDCVAVGFSQLKLSSSTTGNHCLLRILPGDQISRTIEVVSLPRLISFLKPPHTTEGYPSWQLRTEDENQEKFPLRIHRFFKECAPAGDSHGRPVEIKCNAAGKRVRLQWEWCAPHAHIRDPVTTDRSRAHSN